MQLIAYRTPPGAPGWQFQPPCDDLDLDRARPEPALERGRLPSLATSLVDLDADFLGEGHFGIYKGRQEIVRFVSSFMR